LDSTTGAIRNETPFVPLGVDGSFWLVRKNGEKSGSWSYDPSSEGYIGHFTDEEPILGYEQAFLSPDGRSRAWILADMPTGWQGGELRGTFLLQRDGRRGEIRVPIVMQALAGSDVPVIPRGTSLAFTRDGAVEFSATTGKTGADDRVWSVEIATGKIVESRRPHPPQAERDFSMFHGAPAPEYLRPYLKDLTHFGRRGLAPAFLLSMGVLKQRPEYPACEAGVSPDGRHILYKANEGPLADVFIYGDLQTKQILRWPRPAGMKPGNSMEFVWVEAP